jgi:hypothetical protein
MSGKIVGALLATVTGVLTGRWWLSKEDDAGMEN